MEIDFYTQSTAFVYSILLGMVLGILYGPFKALRLFILKSKISIIIADSLFMIISAILVFLYSLAMIYGFVRFYILVGAFLGFAFYRKTLGELVFKIYSPILILFEKIFKKIVKKLLKNTCKILYNIENKSRMIKDNKLFLFRNKRVIVENERNKKIKKITDSVDESLNNSSIKEIQPKKSKKKGYIFLYLAIIGFVFYAVITIVNQNIEIANKKAELNELNKQINVVEIQTKYLEKVQGYEGKQLEEYIAKIAKDDLGYVSDGERIFINVAGD